MSEVAKFQKPKLIERMAERFGLEANAMMSTLKATAFRTRTKDPISNEQMAALLVVADQYELNPWTKEIYAFPDKFGGIVPVVGVDGWSRIINSHPAFDGMDFAQSDEIAEAKERVTCPEWIECTIYRKDRSHPVTVREYLDECYRPPFKQPGPWQTHTKRFLRHKAMIQCARIAFGFVGIFDPDEAERIIEGEVAREAPRRHSVMQAVLEESPIEIDGALVQEYVSRLKDEIFEQNDLAILEMHDEMDNDTKLAVSRKLDSTDRSYIRALLKARNGGDNDETTAEQ